MYAAMYQKNLFYYGGKIKSSIVGILLINLRALQLNSSPRYCCKVFSDKIASIMSSFIQCSSRVSFKWWFTSKLSLKAPTSAPVVVKSRSSAYWDYPRFCSVRCKNSLWIRTFQIVDCNLHISKIAYILIKRSKNCKLLISL